MGSFEKRAMSYKAIDKFVACEKKKKLPPAIVVLFSSS